MITKFWEGIGSKLAEGWAATVVTPAFLFWAGGLGAAFSNQRHHDPLSDLEEWLDPLPSLLRIALLVGGFLLVAASGTLIQRLDLSTLRLLEGYWPRWLAPIRRRLVRWQSFWLDRHDKRFQELMRKGLQELNPEERNEFVFRDLKMMRAPSDPALRMPTRLGNVLRAAESRTNDRYGLDAIICWPRLWLLLAEPERQELEEARARLDSSVRAFTWGLLFFVWIAFAWWAVPVGLAVMIFAYRAAIRAGEAYSDLLQSVFDLRRTSLYEALRWPLPTNPSEERQSGEQVTEYLWRGSSDESPVFRDAPQPL